MSNDECIKRYKIRRYKRLLRRLDAAEDIEWITLKNGVHVPLKNGKAVGGPIKGKKLYARSTEPDFTEEDKERADINRRTNRKKKTFISNDGLCDLRPKTFDDLVKIHDKLTGMEKTIFENAINNVNFIVEHEKTYLEPEDKSIHLNLNARAIDVCHELGHYYDELITITKDDRKLKMSEYISELNGGDVNGMILDFENAIGAKYPGDGFLSYKERKNFKDGLEKLKAQMFYKKGHLIDNIEGVAGILNAITKDELPLLQEFGNHDIGYFDDGKNCFREIIGEYVSLRLTDSKDALDVLGYCLPTLKSQLDRLYTEVFCR